MPGLREGNPDPGPAECSSRRATSAIAEAIESGPPNGRHSLRGLSRAPAPACAQDSISTRYGRDDR